MNTNFSKLMLGTVQFGMNYGIANTEGKPSFERVCDILKSAAEGGITSLDTAAAYGTSEEILGEALEKLGLRDSMTVISKVPPINAKRDADAEKFIEKTLRESLRRLKLDQLSVCLLHREDDLRFFPLLEKMVDRGLIGGAGISLDSDRFLSDVTSIPYIQLPYNVLDKRFDPFWSVAEKNKIKIFTRSVYLQGLLLMPEENIRPALSDVITVRRKLERLAYDAGLSMAELCMRYVLSNPTVTGVLTGVDTVEQLRENLRLASLGPLPQELVLKIHECVPELPEAIVRPALWSTL
jgi:aryl-alcohol dehydrogenase-like predicted oxidoreductase